MAGTRLLIQSIALLQLLGLTLWSLQYGLCRNDDVMCKHLWAWLNPRQVSEIPLMKSTTSSEPPVYLAQVVSAPSSTTSLAWEVNQHAATVCENPQSHWTEEHPLWLCSKNHQQHSHMVVRNQSLVVFYSSQDDDDDVDLDSLLLPVFKPRSPLSIHLVVEESSSQDTVQRTKQWAQTLEDWISLSRLDDWPCVQELDVSIDVVSPLTQKWLVQQQQQQQQQQPPQEDEPADTTTTTPMLPPLRLSQVDSLLQASLPSTAKETNLQLVVYIASVVPMQESSWMVDTRQLFVMPTSSDALELNAVSQWLGSYMGLPMDNIEMISDGSFPKWYSTHYWEAASQDQTQQVIREFDRVRHLLLSNDDDDDKFRFPSDNDPMQRYQELSRLHQRLLHQERTTMLESEFPLEHYAAIFAPLLFPLIIPFLASVVKEWKRYQEKMKKKKD